jgi:hypothetical protein
MKTFIVMCLVVFIVLVGGVRIVKDISLKQNCTGYLKRAADANTVETAIAQLQKSINYLEVNDITDGYTSVLWRTPDEDVKFWYDNLKASEAELMKVDSTTSSLEKTNMLMKLRETLIDNGEKGDTLTVPKGLSRYPNNTLWGILTTFATVILIGLVITLYVKVSD